MDKTNVKLFYGPSNYDILRESEVNEEDEVKKNELINNELHEQMP